VCIIAAGAQFGIARAHTIAADKCRHTTRQSASLSASQQASDQQIETI
jgi:hypothetical protein